MLFAGHHSKKDADQEHPYGHQRFETAASLALGTLLLSGRRGNAVVSHFASSSRRDTVPRVHIAALWVSGRCARSAKELLFRYMLASRQAGQIRHAGRQCLACALRCGFVIGRRDRRPGQFGRLPAYWILSQHVLVGFLVAKMGWSVRMASVARLDGPIGRRQLKSRRFVSTLLDTPERTQRARLAHTKNGRSYRR